jgi:hypothetical protein
MEFCDLVRYYYGDRAYVVSQIAFNLSLQASNIASMIVSAQVLDDFIVHVFGTSYALDYASFTGVRATSPHGDAGDGNIWFNAAGQPINTVISLGYLVSMALCIPFGVLKLDENIWYQWVSCAGLIFFSGEFFVQFVMSCFPGEPGYQPEAGTHNTPFFSPNQAQVLGVAMFAYAYVVTIPSWLNEKKPGVGVNISVWWPALVGFIMKILMGLLGAWAFANASDNILTNLASSSMPEFTRYSSYFWNILTLLPGIPILAIMIKYNLLTGRIANPFWANFFGVVLPWIVTAFCYEQQLLSTLCNWVAILVQGYINFLVPILVYRRALIEFPQPEDGVSWARKAPHRSFDEEIRSGISLQVASHRGTATPMPMEEVGGRDLYSPSKRAESVVRREGVTEEGPSKGPQWHDIRNDTPVDHSMIVGSATPTESLLHSRKDEPRSLNASPHDDDDDSTKGPTVRFAGEHDPEGGALLACDDCPDEPPVDAVPKWMRAIISPLHLATCMAVFFTVLCSAFVVFNIAESIAGVST